MTSTTPTAVTKADPMTTTDLASVPPIVRPEATTLAEDEVARSHGVGDPPVP